MIGEGTRVKVKDSEIDRFVRPVADRIRGRVGVVIARTYPSPMYAIVDFPAVGRRKEYRAGMMLDKWLEIVPDEEKL